MVSVQLVPKYLHMIEVMRVFHAANEKNRTKTILKQDSNSIERQEIVPVSNLKARKIKLCCRCQSTWLIIDLLSLLSLHCRSAVAPAVSPLLLLLSIRCHYAVTTLSLRCHYAAASFAPLPLLLLRCHSFYCSCCHSTVTPAVDLLSIRYCSVISPLSLCCCSAAAAVTPSVAPLLSLLSLLLSLLLSFG